MASNDPITAGIYDRRNGVQGQYAQQQSEDPHVRFGSKADIGASQNDVRFTPKSGHWLSVSGCPLCATSGLTHRSKIVTYSTTLVGASKQRRRYAADLTSSLPALRVLDKRPDNKYTFRV